MRYSYFAKKYGTLCCSLLLFLFSSEFCFGQSSVLLDATPERDQIIQALQTQIDSLESLELSLTESDEQLKILKQQLKDLQNQIQDSKTVSTEQAKLLTILAVQFQDLKNSKAVTLKNFEGLLLVSNKYKQALKTSETLNWILGGVVVVVSAIAILRK